MKEAARTGDRDVLEEVWLEALEAPGEAEDFLGALELLDDKTRAECAVALLPLVLETYEGMKRHEDAMLVARALAVYQPDDPFLRRSLLKHMRAALAGEEWLEAFLHTSGLLERARLDEGLKRFDSFAPYKPGRVLEHGAGWGVGVIEGFNEFTFELKIRFEDRCRRELPISSAMDSLKVLEPDHLKALLMTDPEALRKRAKDEPSFAIQKALQLNRGRPLNAMRLKEFLVDKVIPARDWPKWWSHAKKDAAKDPYLRVEGGSRPVFHLRSKPVTLEEEALRNVGATEGVLDAVIKVREYLVNRPDRALKKQLLDEVKKKVELGLEGEEELIEILDGILLLEEHHHESPSPSVEVIRELMGEEPDAEVTEALFTELGTERGSHLALVPFQEALPRDWPRLLTDAYPGLPRELMDSAADLLVKQGHEDLLIGKYRQIMEAPWKDPWPTYYLSRRFAAGAEGGPGIAEIALTLLKCMESPLFHDQGAKMFIRDMMKRYTELLFDSKRKILKRCVEKGTRFELTRAMDMVHITSMVPEEVQQFLVSEIPYRYPDLVRIKDKPFWEDDFIFCTRAGIDKRSLELRELTNEKLPAIFKAIGKAAEFGDLSENAEWTAAMEEQRLLTEKAGQIEEELGMAKAIDDQNRPEGVVVPGTRVTVRRVEDDRVESFTILGPWDIGIQGVISYKAPLAASLLGVKQGEQATIQLPESSYDVVVESVEISDG